MQNGADKDNAGAYHPSSPSDNDPEHLITFDYIVPRVPATRKDGDKEVEVFARKMRRSLGDKRNELVDEHILELRRIAQVYEEGLYAKRFDTTDFGYRKITVERPLRLNFQASPERIVRLGQQTAFQTLAMSRKKGKASEQEIAEGRRKQEEIVTVLRGMGEVPLCRNRAVFSQQSDTAFDAAGLRLAAPLKKAVLNALAKKDPTADPCVDADGNPEPDPVLRDCENVPLKEDIQAYFEREVLPHVPDAWISKARRDRDEKDGEVGKVGYEINFNRYFYEYVPPRPLDTIDREIQQLAGEILALLREVAV